MICGRFVKRPYEERRRRRSIKSRIINPGCKSADEQCSSLRRGTAMVQERQIPNSRRSLCRRGKNYWKKEKDTVYCRQKKISFSRKI